MEMSRPLAVVGTTAIRENDIDETILAMGAAGAQFNTPQGRAEILNQLIEQALFLTDARKNMLEYDPAFKAQLAKVKDDLLVQFAIAKAIEKVRVSESEIKAFFDEHPEQFAGREMANANHILVDDEATAIDLREKILSGAISFEDAAKRYSRCPSAPEGGALGEFSRGQMVPEFEQACFALGDGEISAPVRTQFGWHLIRLNEKKNSDPVSFAQARGAIVEHLTSVKQKEAYTRKVNQMKILYPVNRTV